MDWNNYSQYRTSRSSSNETQPEQGWLTHARPRQVPLEDAFQQGRTSASHLMSYQAMPEFYGTAGFQGTAELIGTSDFQHHQSDGVEGMNSVSPNSSGQVRRAGYVLDYAMAMALLTGVFQEAESGTESLGARPTTGSRSVWGGACCSIQSSFIVRKRDHPSRERGLARKCDLAGGNGVAMGSDLTRGSELTRDSDITRGSDLTMGSDVVINTR
ncbi:MAG: hypothetical protein Q9198_000065 [Flavoplaca austrocitrina]